MILGDFWGKKISKSIFETAGVTVVAKNQIWKRTS